MNSTRENFMRVMPVGAGSGPSLMWLLWRRRLDAGRKNPPATHPGESRVSRIDYDSDHEHELNPLSAFSSLRAPRSALRASFAAGFLLLLFLLAACRQGMYDQPKFLPLQENGMYPDQAASRPLPPGTVAAVGAREAAVPQTGRVGGVLIENVPLPLTREFLERGRQRFNIFCAPCHDQLGYGTGMIVRRGIRNPPSYHIPRLVNAPDGYFFEVMTDGYGMMYSYADRVAPRDRWAIVAYIRALEVSQHATPADVPLAERPKLEGGATP